MSTRKPSFKLTDLPRATPKGPESKKRAKADYVCSQDDEHEVSRYGKKQAVEDEDSDSSQASVDLGDYDTDDSSDYDDDGEDLKDFIVDDDDEVTESDYDESDSEEEDSSDDSA